LNEDKRARIFKKSFALISESKNGFVIFSAYDIEKFIQFATNEDDSLHLDLPLLAPCQP